MWSTVHFVTSYDDGPSKGLADFAGDPVHFSAIFDELQDEYTDSFVLRRLPEPLLQAYRADFARFETWESLFLQGQTTIEEHPNIKAENTELNDKIDRITPFIKVNAKFHRSGAFGWRNWAVRWMIDT